MQLSSIRKYTISAAALAATALAALSQNNIVEEVAWVVGDQPIYKSQIEETYQQMLYERVNVPGDPYCVIPEQLAVEKLYLHQAEVDTIEVQEAMVSQQVEARINMLIENIGSKEKIEEYFRKPLPEFREQLAQTIRDNYRIMQVQDKITGDIKVTPSDVRRYFNNLAEDSIPMVPLQVETQIITLNPEIPRAEIEDIKARLRDYSDQVNRGERDFYTLAVLYSQDEGSARRGGETGFLGRGHLEPEYAAVAFNLNDPKKVSKIVETQYGFHIIQLIEKRGDRINTRHILLRPKVSDADLTKAINRLDSIRADILADKFTFDECTQFISQDKDTRNNRGVMVNQENGTIRFEMADLPAEVAKEVNKLEPGQISEPFIMIDPKRNCEVVAIVKLTDRIPAHKANMSDDYQLIKGMCESSLKQKKLKDWLDKKIKDTYVRIEDGWDNCEFKHDGWLKLRR
ncbi:MAG: peptidylprolyl isomerase [Bacteroidales bacterium]|nr:peptidylprolyl isomerase [Bacteroidales bacterium]MBD5247816.1 peptidylprolyl isomerase [Barnesiella sp.]MBD5257876.1 peptidylprolyl isomerase [Barnesiella sp.]